eukprot:3219589-Pleurochrysis_carterae.AAC.8
MWTADTCSRARACARDRKHARLHAAMRGRARGRAGAHALILQRARACAGERMFHSHGSDDREELRIRSAKPC